MKHYFAISLALATAVAVTGCARKTSGTGGQVSGPAWTLTLQSKCHTAAEDECIAAHGFSIRADGKYEVGPGPLGQRQQGSLSAEELAPIESAVNAIRASTLAAEESEQTIAESGSDDVLTLFALGGEPKVLARNEGTSFKFRLANQEDALSLLTAVSELAERYYALPSRTSAWKRQMRRTPCFSLPSSARWMRTAATSTPSSPRSSQAAASSS
jgi:hypothetical protein